MKKAVARSKFESYEHVANPLWEVKGYMFLQLVIS